MSGNDDKLHVLMLDDGRQVLPFLQSLHRAGHQTAVACGSKLTAGYFSRYAGRRLMWGDYFHDPEGFTSHLLAYVHRYRPDVVLSVGDVSAGILARNQQDLSQYTRLTAPPLDVFEQAADKARTMAFCMRNNIPCPHTYFPEEDCPEAFLPKMRFPVMVKPRRGIGAIGLRRIETAEEFLREYPSLRQRYGDLLVQEFIPQEGGTQFQAEAFLDADSRMKVCLVIAKPRFFPVTGGTSTANVSIRRPDIQENVRKLLEGLRWRGAADVDLILDPRDNVPKVLEINPRVTAGIRIGFAAGIDYADLHLRLALGKEVPVIDHYRLGVYSRNLCMDLLWYLFSNREMRRKTWPPFFRFFGRDVCEQLMTADDPMPFVGFVLGMIKKYAHPGVWRKKLGWDV